MERVAVGPVVVVYGVEGDAVAVRLETPGGDALGSFAIRTEADIGSVVAALRAAIVDATHAAAAPAAAPSLLDELLEDAVVTGDAPAAARRAAPTVAEVIAAQGDASRTLIVFGHGYPGTRAHVGVFAAPERIVSPLDGVTRWRIAYKEQGSFGGARDSRVEIAPWETVYFFAAQKGDALLYGFPSASAGFAGMARFLAEKFAGREPIAVGVLGRPSAQPFVPEDPFAERLAIPADARAAAWRVLRGESHVARAVRTLAHVESDAKAREFLEANAENRKQTRVVVYSAKTGHTYVALVFPQGIAPTLLVHREPNRGRWTPRAAEAGETDPWKEVASAFLSGAYAEPVGDEAPALQLHKHLRALYAQGGKVLGADDREALYTVFASAPKAYATDGINGKIADLVVSLRVDVSDLTHVRFGEGAVGPFGDANLERFAEIPLYWPRTVGAHDGARLREMLLAMRSAVAKVAHGFRPFAAAVVAYLRESDGIAHANGAPVYYVDAPDLYRIRADVARALGEAFAEPPESRERYHPVIRTRQTYRDTESFFRPFTVRVREIAVRHGDAVFLHPLDDDGTPMISASAVERTPIVQPYRVGDPVYVASAEANGIVAEVGERGVGTRPEERVYRVRVGEGVVSYAASELSAGRISEELTRAIRRLAGGAGGNLARDTREYLAAVESAARGSGADAEAASHALVELSESTQGKELLAKREAERVHLAEMVSELAAATDKAIQSGDGFGDVVTRAADGGPSVAARVAAVRAFVAAHLLPLPDLDAFTADRVNAAAKAARDAGVAPEDVGVDLATVPRDASGRRYASARDLVVKESAVQVRGATRYSTTSELRDLVTEVRTAQLSRWMCDYANGGVDARAQTLEARFNSAHENKATGLWSPGGWEVPREAPHVQRIDAGAVLRELVPPAHGTDTTRRAVVAFASSISTPNGGSRASLVALKVSAAKGVDPGKEWRALPLWIEAHADGSLRLRLHPDHPLYLTIAAVAAEGDELGKGRFVFDDGGADAWTRVVDLLREPCPAPVPDNPLALWRMSVREAEKTSGYKAKSYLEAVRICHGFAVANALRHGWPVPIEARAPHGFLAVYPLDGAPPAEVKVEGDDGAAFVVAHSAEEGTTVTPLRGETFRAELINAMRSLPHGLAGFKWLDEPQRYYRQQSRGTARPTANLAHLADHIRRVTGQPVRVVFTETSEAEARDIFLRHKAENAERSAARAQALADRAEKLIAAAHGARDRSFSGNTERRRRLAAGSHERLLREAREAQRRAKELAGRAVRVARVAGAEPRSIEDYIANAREVAARVDGLDAAGLSRREREQFERAMASQGGADFFPTSSEIAARMADEAGVGEFDTVLEPSAGMGVLVDAAVSRGASVFALELDADRLEYLRARYGANDRVAVLAGDFLEDTENLPHAFDVVLMNPPFSAPGTRHGYAAHIRRALEFLRPGGTIAAIAPRSLMFSDDREPRELRELFASWGAVPVDLPDDAFKAAGTQVRTVLVVARKPGGDEARDDDAEGDSAPAVDAADDSASAPAEAASTERVSGDGPWQVLVRAPGEKRSGVLTSNGEVAINKLMGVLFHDRDKAERIAAEIVCDNEGWAARVESASRGRSEGAEEAAVASPAPEAPAPPSGRAPVPVVLAKRNEVTLYARHPNRLADDEIARWGSAPTSTTRCSSGKIPRGDTTWTRRSPDSCSSPRAAASPSPMR